MNGWFAVAVLLAIPAGTWLGVYIGRTWSSLPELLPGSQVEFKGSKVGTGYRLVVQQVTRDQDGVSVSLVSSATFDREERSR